MIRRNIGEILRFGAGLTLWLNGFRRWLKLPVLIKSCRSGGMATDWMNIRFLRFDSILKFAEVVAELFWSHLLQLEKLAVEVGQIIKS